jgi:hypothetical protein
MSIATCPASLKAQRGTDCDFFTHIPNNGIDSAHFYFQRIIASLNQCYGHQLNDPIPYCDRYYAYETTLIHNQDFPLFECSEYGIIDQGTIFHHEQRPSAFELFSFIKGEIDAYISSGGVGSTCYLHLIKGAWEYQGDCEGVIPVHI